MAKAIVLLAGGVEIANDNDASVNRALVDQHPRQGGGWVTERDHNGVVTEFQANAVIAIRPPAPWSTHELSVIE